MLAATLSPTYGVYSGFESFERTPVKPGSEEYDHSEKYEVKERTLDGPLLTLISRLNDIRRENPALQHLDNIQFLTTENDALIAYAKRTGDNTIISVVTLDPVNAQEGVVVVPYGLGLPPVFTVTDLLSQRELRLAHGAQLRAPGPLPRRAPAAGHVSTPVSTRLRLGRSLV